jgi:cell division protein FtsW
MVYSASAGIALDRYNYERLFLVKHVTWALVGTFLGAVVMQIDYRNYRQPAIIWTGLAIVLIGLIAVLFERPHNGATRWLNVGQLGIQPSELAKIVMIVFTAALLERRMDRIAESPYALVPIGVALAFILGLILVEPDLGTAVTVFMIVAVMLFAAGISYRYVVGVLLTAPIAFYVLVMMSDFRRKRIMAFLDPWADPLNTGYQAVQSMIAVGTGGVFGRGLMAGVQKWFYLPEPHNDFIYAVISEELGLLGATVVLACFCVITWRGLITATRAPDRFGAFLAIGLTTMVAFQSFFNISVVLGLAPTKGIPLPFVSYGGSSLVINLLGMAMLLNVSQHASSTHVVTTHLPTPDA